MTVSLRPLTLADVPRLLELEHTLFGPGAWTEGMLREELTGNARFYIGVDAPVAEAGRVKEAPALTERGTAEGSTAEHAASADPVAETPAVDSPATELVGYAGTWFDGQDAQVMTIGVAPEHQGRGLGRLLLAAILDRERERGAERVFLEVRIDNDLAIAMYERAGFERLAVRRGYYQPENVDALTMRLVLQPHPATRARR